MTHTPTDAKGDLIGQCTRKIAYVSPQQAGYAANGAKRRGKILHVYQCPHCGMYHLSGMVLPKSGSKGNPCPPQELIDAVLPCLPLPGIARLEVAKVPKRLFDYSESDDEVTLDWLVTYADDSPVPQTGMLQIGDVVRLIIGALDQACVENCWEVIRHAMLGHYTRINYGSMRSEFVSVNGTDAAAFCRAYAQAKEATK